MIDTDNYIKCYEKLNDAVYITSRGKLVYVNNAFVNLFGYNKDELLQINPLDLIVNGLEFNEQVREKIAKNESDLVDAECVRKDGSRLVLEISYSALEFDLLDNFYVVVGVARDVTELRKRKRENAARRNILTSVIENISTPVFYKDKDLRFIDCNSAFSNFICKSKAEIIGKTVFEVFSSAQSKIYSESDARIMANKGSQIYNNIINNGNGVPRNVIISKRVFYNADNEVAGIVGTYIDVTDIVANKRKLKVLTTAIEQSESTIVITDKNGNIEYANPMFEKTTGYTVEETLGQNPRILKTNYYSEEFYKELWIVITSGKTWRGEFHNKRKDGSEYWESAIISPVIGSDGNIFNFIAIKDDITEEKKIKKLLIEEEKRYRTIFENAADAILIADSDTGVIIECNNAAEKLFRTSKENIIGLHQSKLHPQNHVEFEFSDSFNRHKNGINQTIEGVILRFDGSICDVFISGSSIEFNNKKALLGFFKDISVLKIVQQELIFAKEKAEESDRLKSAFLANMSHEIRTPLNAIMGFAELLKLPNLTENKRSDFLDIINVSGKGLLQIINDVIDLSKIESGLLLIDRKPIALDNMMLDIYNLFSVEASRKGLKLEYVNEINNESVYVILDEIRIKQIMTNFIGNALKFTHEGGVDFVY